MYHQTVLNTLQNFKMFHCAIFKPIAVPSYLTITYVTKNMHYDPLGVSLFSVIRPFQLTNQFIHCDITCTLLP